MQIKARACRRHSAEADFFVAVNNVEHCTAVGQKPLLKALVKGVAVRVLGVVVNPNAVNKIQRIVVIFIIFVKCVVEYVLLNRVDTDGISAHILNVLKPALIGFLVNGKVGRPFAGLSRTNIYAFDFKRLVVLAVVH